MQVSGSEEKGKIKGEAAARTEWRLMAEKLQNKVDVARRTPSLIWSVPQERAVPSYNVPHFLLTNRRP